MSKLRVGLAVAAVAMLPLVAGCEKKAQGQVVAVVNGLEITQQELNAELEAARIPDGADKKAAMAQLLQRVIDRKLLVSKAKADGLDQSPSYLGQVARAQDAILIDLLAARKAKTVPVPDAAAAQKFIAGNPALFGQRKRYALDQIAFSPPNDPALGKKLGAAQTMAEIEAALKAANIQFVRGTAALDTAALPPEAAQKIASLKPGEPFLVPQNGQVVASVIRGAEAVPVAEQQAIPAATQLLRRQEVEAAMKKDLDAERAKAKIEYQPGFAPPAKKDASAPAK